MSPQRKRKKGKVNTPEKIAAAPMIVEALAQPTEAPTEPKVPNISVLERRLLDPTAGGSTPIRLKDASLIPRWVNTDSALHDRYARATAQQGWVPVRIDQLEDPNVIGGLQQSPDGLVRRGDRGQEILMCMPADFNRRIQDRKVEQRLARERSSSKQKHELLNSLAKVHGDEAADYMDKHVRGEILETVERVDSPGSG